MGRPLVYDIVQKPVSTVIITVCSLIWFFIQKKGISYADVGVNYDAVVLEGQYWRFVSSSLSHISFLHLVFNMSALWSLGVVESLNSVGLGKVYYIKYSLLMLILSGLLVLGLYHLLIFKFRLEHFKRVTAVGYSCVVFGWMTILAVKQPSSKLNLFGVLSLPISLAPFESLIFTSILVPQASFVGHLSGVVVGYLIAWGLFQGLSDYWAIMLAVWIAIACVISLKKSTAFEMPYFKIEPVTDLEMPPVLWMVDSLPPPTTDIAVVPDGELLV